MPLIDRLFNYEKAYFILEISLKISPFLKVSSE